MTCSICPGSAFTAPNSPPGIITRSMSSPIRRVSIFRFSVITAFRSSTFGVSICFRLNARSCRVSEVARSAAAEISFAGPRSAGSGPSRSNRNSEYPEITISRLLKSCAIPPASRPIASIFCDCRNCCSRARRSVTSSVKISNVTVFEASLIARPESRTAVVVPSFRVHSQSNP